MAVSPVRSGNFSGRGLRSRSPVVWWDVPMSVELLILLLVGFPLVVWLGVKMLRR